MNKERWPRSHEKFQVFSKIVPRYKSYSLVICLGYGRFELAGPPNQKNGADIDMELYSVVPFARSVLLSTLFSSRIIYFLCYCKYSNAVLEY